MGRRTWLYCGALLLVVIASSSCSVGVSGRSRTTVASRRGPPAHAPAHGYRRKHAYRYYPSAHVYFDIERRVYFYMDAGNWRVGARLPAGIHVDVGEAVQLSLATETPYVHFHTHKATYPPGQSKKHSGSSGKSKGKPPGRGKGPKGL